MSKHFNNKKRRDTRGLLANPLFYFGVTALLLWGMPFFSFSNLASLDNLQESDVLLTAAFFKDAESLKDSDLFVGHNSQLAKESPDLKIIQDNFVYGIATPRILTTQTLGDMFGEGSHSSKEISDYEVEDGDTIKSIAGKFGVSEETIAWANELSNNSSLKVGDNLIILPIDGLLHVVKSGDTVSELARIYNANVDDIISFNGLANEGDIFIGDPLVIPYGKMPAKVPPSVHIVLPSTFFIIPTEGTITQLRHFFNAFDEANKCGTPIYAAAGGVVQRVRFDYRYGNYITILHDNGTSTYYGHLQAMFVQPGERVETGYHIGAMGRTGTQATGCHLHFGVTGAENPLARYALGAVLKYK